MRHESEYVSCNCNQTPTAVHWGKNNLICYTSCNSIRIYDPKFGSGGKIIATLIGHSQRVNSVRWITQVRSETTETELVSGAADGTAIVWTKMGDSYDSEVLKGHTSLINLVDGLWFNGKTVIVTASMDSSVKIWLRSESRHFIESQSINYDYSICVGLKLGAFLDAGTLILACALDNSKIEIYTEEGQFTKSVVLSGHEDWVRGLDFTQDNDDLLLASSSQDCYIRLWRFSKKSGGKILEQLQIGGCSYKVSLDSVLTGHEGWVYSVQWSLKSLQLLSSSLDKSMIVWELDKGSNLWVEKIRVGEVGGNTLGFYGGVFSPDGKSILGHGYHGAFHIWADCHGEWKPATTVGGHFAEVADLSWEAQGQFLISVSKDQTTRIHAPWSQNGKIVSILHCGLVVGPQMCLNDTEYDRTYFLSN